MLNSLAFTRVFPGPLVRAVIVPTTITLSLLAALVGAVLHFSTTQSDLFARDRQDRLVRIAVRQTMERIAIDQEASTYWDDAVLKVRQSPLDRGWIDNNLGIWFHKYYGHDETYLLDRSDNPVYAMQSGLRVRPDAFAKVSEPARRLTRSLRQALPAGYAAPEGTSGQTVGAADIALVHGRPAIISVKPIVSETGNILQTPGSEFLHVSIRYLDGSFLQTLSQLYGIDRPFVSARPHNQAFMPIRASDGRTLAYLNWAAFAPGEDVESKMQPALFAALAVIGLLLGFLLFRLWRSRTELEASRAQAQHLAFHDSLTGLPNRALFEDRLDHALSRRESKVGVLLLDLDRFKNVNDTLGHQAGDALIREFGIRLSTLTRQADTVARLGGDEFAILVEECEPKDLHHLAGRIIDKMTQPFSIVGSEIHIGVSIGIARGVNSESDRLELVRKADIALYHAKDTGRATYCLFKPHMDDTVKLRAQVEEELRSALMTGRGLTLNYQPQVDSSGTVIGLEALLRWDHPERGSIAPEQFVAVAEDSGLIIPLGEWVLQEACTVSRRWPDLFVAVNLSPVQFRSEDFFDHLMRIVRRTGANPRCLQLEVTERVLLDDNDSVRATLSKLRTAGFTIALDDFGTGYSSLSYLRKFQVDKIKIDRSFVQHLGEAADSAGIISAVLALGHAMGLSVAAEGVETAAQKAFLEVAGCAEMQGYYFSRAVPAEELALLLGVSSPASSAA